MSKKIDKMLYEGRKAITGDLLTVIGLFVDKNGYIIDSDTCKPFEYNGRCLRSTLFGCSITHHGDVEFDAFNVRMIVTLFNFILNRSTNEDGIYYRLSYEEKINVPNCDFQKSRLILGSSNGDIVSDYYFNDTYKYIDIIYKVCGNGLIEEEINNLTTYDYIEYKIK